MKKFYYLLLVLVVSLLLVGCGASQNVPDVAPDYNGDSFEGSNDGLVIETTRKIYYTVDMNIQTDNVQSAYEYYTSKVYLFNGYVSKSTINSTGSSTVVYKVPTDKLTEFLDYIEKSDEGEVVRKSTSSNDITTKYNAVEARLEVLRSSRNSYLKMLEKASNINEIMTLQNKIEDIDTEILRLENEKGSYDNLLDYSSVTIYFNQTIKDDFFGDYFDYFFEFFRILGIIILYSIPFGIVAGAVLTVIFVSIKIKKRRG